jgi:predicted DNA-binding transcriptional regulator AlpA
MPHPQASSDAGSKHSFASTSEARILTDVQVAERLGVSRFTVRSWRLKGVGPRFLKMGRAVRYRSHDLDEYERQALVETQGPSDHSPM